MKITIIYFRRIPIERVLLIYIRNSKLEILNWEIRIIHVNLRTCLFNTNSYIISFVWNGFVYKYVSKRIRNSYLHDLCDSRVTRIYSYNAEYIPPGGSVVIILNFKTCALKNFKNSICCKRNISYCYFYVNSFGCIFKCNKNVSFWLNLFLRFSSKYNTLCVCMCVSLLMQISFVVVHQALLKINSKIKRQKNNETASNKVKWKKKKWRWWSKWTLKRKEKINCHREDLISDSGFKCFSETC